MQSENQFMVCDIMIIHFQYEMDHNVPGLAEK